MCLEAVEAPRFSSGAEQNSPSRQEGPTGRRLRDISPKKPFPRRLTAAGTAFCGKSSPPCLTSKKRLGILDGGQRERHERIHGYLRTRTAELVGLCPGPPGLHRHREDASGLGTKDPRERSSSTLKACDCTAKPCRSPRSARARWASRSDKTSLDRQSEKHAPTSIFQGCPRRKRCWSFSVA
jgi:hypothetical protein